MTKKIIRLIVAATRICPEDLFRTKSKHNNQKTKTQSASANITATTKTIKPPISEAKEKETKKP